MGIIIDTAIIAVCLVIVLVSRKKGAFLSIMNFSSGIVSLLLAYTFTPLLSAYLNEKIFLKALSSSVSDTVASLCEAGVNAAGKAVYDIASLAENSQFLSILEKYKSDKSTVSKAIEKIADTSRAGIDKLSDVIASPIAKTVSDICAFAAILIASFIVLLIITAIVSKIFDLPVLRDIDKKVGTVFGIIGAFLFVLVISMLAGYSEDFLSSAAPSMFPENFCDSSLILRVFTRINVLTLITDAVAFS